MNKPIWYAVLLAAAMLPAVASAQKVVLSGKTSSKVTAHVTRPNNLFVTNDTGGWFDQGLEMQQLGGWDTAFEAQARLKIVSSSGTFQVRLDAPLSITHQSNPELVFRTPRVTLGIEGGAPKPLTLERIVVDGGGAGGTAAPLFVSAGYGVVIYQLRGEER
ncbi:hypothetical protein [Burkholderia sp. 22PA0106]|uniref:hypothetical protein n=1 Tax=Burkholderia sp. 22PA0106 TaxID=3237371 RepID=UPI0039C34B5B